MSKAAKVLIVSIIVLIAVFAIKTSLKQKGSALDAKYIFPEYMHVKNIRLVSGILVPQKEVTLKSKISGIIEELYVKVGQKVNKGDAIARVKLLADPRNVEISEKQLKLAGFYFNESEIKYTRNKKLYDDNVISKSEFEVYQKDYLVTNEEFLSAKKQLEIVKKGFAEGKADMANIVKSTISGIVLDLPLKEGNSVTESNTFNDGSTIAIIADMNEMVFKAKVAEKDIQYLKQGMVFEISVNAIGNKKFKTELINISSKGKEENGVMKFDIEGKVLLANDKSISLRSGFTSVAEIVLEEAQHVLTIDEKLLVFSNDSNFVYIDFNNKKIKTAIQIGISDGVRVEVKKGITEKDKLIEKEEL